MKTATTGFLILGILLLFSYPWLVGPPPPGRDKQEIAEYATRLGFYIISALLVWATTAMLAIIVARRARQNYRHEAMENFQHLLEETLKDHGKRES